MRRPAASLLLAILTLTGCSSGPGDEAGRPHPLVPQGGTLSAHLELIDTGLDSPVAIAFPPGSSTPHVVEQDGRIRRRDGSTWNLFMDIRGRVLSGGERGLLGLAFDPDYQSNRRFYVYYTDSAGDLRISRFVRSTTRAVGLASSEHILLDIPHRAYSNHNGGNLQFGPNDLLYIGTGDGGSGGGPNGYAQSKTSLLGKILRIDPSRSCGGRDYCVPGGNPFVVNGRRSEILHWGLRNPWRFFITSAGQMYIGDVGQDTLEEVDVIASGATGVNLGWDCREGTNNTVSTYGGAYCSGRTFTGPVHVYSHASGRCSITGGVIVYDGGPLQGRYLFADYCTGEIWQLYRSGGDWRSSRIINHDSSIPSFGRNKYGRAFVVDTAGRYFRVVASN